MASRVSPILDSFGRPFVNTNGKRRFSFAETPRRQREIAATYDSARHSTETENYWANSDSYDADSANSKGVRESLVRRSRYQLYNDGYSDGIASTWATDMVGKGPSLRMQTGSEKFNQMIENTWWYWCKAIQFRRKLWCLTHAMHSDGEGLAVVRRNPRVNHTVKLDLRLYETEQCQTPFMPFGEPGRIDGIKFDKFGNPIWFDILHEHPGSSNWLSMNLTPERVPARYVLHWFKLRRPGQHRGIPALTSTLNVGAAARRWREATLAAAETAADFAVLLETAYEPDELDSAPPFDTRQIEKRMMTALPNSVRANQMKAEHPTALYGEFHKSLINEQARPKSMPLNRAACDSSGYNFASGRLDDLPYKSTLDVDREDCNDLVLDPLFDVWFESAILTYGWLGGNPDAISPAARAHQWDWPKHTVADTGAEADANDTQLKNGTKSLSTIYTETGLDYEDECEKSAASNGITVEQQKQINLLLNLPQHVLPVVAELLRLSAKPEPPAGPAGDVVPDKNAAAADVNINIHAYSDAQPRDDKGRFGEGGGGGKSSDSKKSGGRAGAPKEQSRSATTKSEIAKASAKRVDASIQRYAEEGNEPELAKSVNGESLRDNEPVDVVTTIDGKMHGVELKTIVDNKNNKLTMKKDAQARKKSWERANKGTVHTVVFDDSRVFNAKGPGKHDTTKREIYYRRGYGSFRVGNMHKVTGGTPELKSLMSANKRSLPPGAK